MNRIIGRKPNGQPIRASEDDERCDRCAVDVGEYECRKCGRITCTTCTQHFFGEGTYCRVECGPAHEHTASEVKELIRQIRGGGRAA